MRLQHEQGLIGSAKFLKHLLNLARDTAAAVKKASAQFAVASLEKKGKAALTELFKSVKNANTPVIAERIVIEIDDIVKIVRFLG